VGLAIALEHQLYSLFVINLAAIACSAHQLAGVICTAQMHRLGQVDRCASRSEQVCRARAVLVLLRWQSRPG